MSDKLVSIKAVMTIANDMVFACHNEREEFEKRLNELIAVPQPMSAEEYAKVKWEICKTSFYCEGCPFGVWRDQDDARSCSEWAAKHPEKAVAIVEKWAKEHPEKKRKTYAEDFHKKHPNALYDSDGTPRSCKRYIYGMTNTPCKTNGCTACWNEEMRKEV